VQMERNTELRFTVVPECLGVCIGKEGIKYLYEGLPVDLRLMSYTDVDKKFDRIFSVGMFEDVGHKN